MRASVAYDGQVSDNPKQSLTLVTGSLPVSLFADFVLNAIKWLPPEGGSTEGDTHRYPDGLLSRPERSRRRTFSGCDLALRMGHEDPYAGHRRSRQLSIIGKLRIGNNLPGLNVIVAGQATGQPGEHVVLREGFTVAREQRNVLKHNWFSVRVPRTGTYRQVWESISA